LISSGEQAVSLAYDKADRLEGLTLPDGIEQVYGYDKAGEATSIAYKKGKSTLGEIDYGYDPNGQTEAMWGSYARLGLPKVVESAKYNAGNELTEREGKELEYDGNGNLISDGSSKYSWNARNQLTQISGATTASFGYDPFGRRESKTLGGTTTDLLYDGPNVVQESVEGSVTANLLTGLEMDQLFSRSTKSGTDSYLTDRLGSVIGLANGSGEVETTYTYDPFGSATEAGKASDNPHQFTGRENDGTGLQYNRARYYSPADGRFISQDPAGFEGSGSNLYWYANGDPVDFTDPSGEHFVIGNWPSEAPSVSSTPFSPNIFGIPPLFAEPQPNFEDPSQPPGPDREWRPKGDTPGTGKGSWWNPNTKEQLRPALKDKAHGSHYDRKRRDEEKGHRVYPDGREEKKK